MQRGAMKLYVALGGLTGPGAAVAMLQKQQAVGQAQIGSVWKCDVQCNKSTFSKRFQSVMATRSGAEYGRQTMTATATIEYYKYCRGR